MTCWNLPGAKMVPFLSPGPCVALGILENLFMLELSSPMKLSAWGEPRVSRGEPGVSQAMGRQDELFSSTLERFCLCCEDESLSGDMSKSS